MRLAAICLLLSAIGCTAKPPEKPIASVPKEPVQAEQKEVPQVPPEQVDVGPPPKDDFQEQLSVFIEEAGSVARGMKLIPKIDVMQKRLEALDELFSRIPEPTGDIKDNHYKCARQICVNFRVGPEYLRLHAQAVGLNSESLMEKTLGSFKELAKSQQVAIQELQAASKDGRLATVELSEVIQNDK